MALLLLVLVPLFRTAAGQPTFPQSQAYDHLLTVDTFDGDTTSLSFFELLLVTLLAFFSPALLSIALPLLFALLSFLLFVGILSKLKLNSYEYYYTLIILSLTPTFIAIHIGLNMYAFLLLIVLLTTWLYLKNNYLYLLGLALLYLVDPFIGLAAGLIFLLKEFGKKPAQRTLYVLFTLIVAQVLLSVLPLNLGFFIQDLFVFNLNSLFTFFGARYGYSLFLLTLGLYGFYYKISTRPLSLTRAFFILVLLFSLFYQPLRIISVLLLSLYAALAFDSLVLRRWKVIFVGQLILIIFFCILVFATTTYLKEDLQQEPRAEHVRALEFIQKYRVQRFIPTDVALLSDPGKSSYLSYYSGLHVLDGLSHLTRNESLAYKLLLSRDYQFVKETLQEERVAFILIDNKMLTGSVWFRPDEGLLFVMENNKNFVRVYSEDGVLIYHFTAWNETRES